MFRQPDFYNLSAGLVGGHAGAAGGVGHAGPGMHEPSKVVKLNYIQFSQSIHSCCKTFGCNFSGDESVIFTYFCHNWHANWNSKRGVHPKIYFPTKMWQ